MKMNIIVISEEEHNSRLDRVIKRVLGNINQSYLEKLLRQKNILVENKKASSFQRVKKGQKISYLKSIEFNESQRQFSISDKDKSFYKKLYSKIIVKDKKNWLCINKPNNIAVQGGSNQKYHIDDLLKAKYEASNVKPRLVHRLDKDTSGLLLVAKNQVSAKEFSKFFQNGKITKVYLALVSPSPENDDGIIKTKIHKSELYKENKMYISKCQGKYSITKFKVLKKIRNKLALLALKPITGRTHQLRLHMHHLGCPILGDKKYFMKESPLDFKDFTNKLKLHAGFLKIPGESLLQADLPIHFKDALEFFGLNIKNNKSIYDYFERENIEN